jgi:hypothetical protein
MSGLCSVTVHGTVWYLGLDGRFDIWHTNGDCAITSWLIRHRRAKPPTPDRYRRPDVKEVHFLRSISFTPKCEASLPFAVDVAYPRI